MQKVPKDGAASPNGGGQKDQAGDIWRSPGGTYVSNDPIPLLYDMPDFVKRQMPASQKELVEKVEGLVRRLEPAKEAANDFSRHELLQRVRDEADTISQTYWKQRKDAGGLDGWVGRFQVSETNPTEVFITFGLGYGWLTHGGKYPYAKDPVGAYLTHDVLYEVRFTKEKMSDAAKAGLAKVRQGEWVRVEAGIEADTFFGWMPRLGMDGKGHIDVEGSHISGQGFDLRDIKPIPAP